MVANTDNAFLPFPIQVLDRVVLQQYMIRRGQDVVIQHIGNAAAYDCFAEFHRPCPTAQMVASSILLLPTYPDYPENAARRNVDLIREFFKSSSHHA
jgi:hypothetical protein